MRGLKHLTKLKSCNDIFGKTKNSEGQQRLCTPFFAPAKVLFFEKQLSPEVARFLLIAIQQMLFFCAACILICHAMLSWLGGGNPSLSPYRSFSHPSFLSACMAFPSAAAHPCLDFVHQINRGTYCDWTSQGKVNFNPSD